MSGNRTAKNFPLHVIEFVTRGRKSKNKSLDVVRTRWFKRDGKKLKVSFPDPPYTQESYDDYNMYLADDADAPPTWSLFTVKVRASAETIPEAMAKLKAVKEGERAWSLSDGTISELERDAENAILRNNLQRNAASFVQSHQPPAPVPTQDTRNNACASARANGQLELDQTSKNSNDDSADLSPRSKTPFDSPAGSSTTSALHYEIPLVTPGNEQENGDKNVVQSETRRSAGEHSKVPSELKNSKNSKSSNKLLKDLIKQIASLTTEIRDLAGKVEKLEVSITQVKSATLHKLSEQITKKFVGTPKAIGEKYNLEIPFKTLDDFEKFDLELKNPKSSLYDDVSLVLGGGLDRRFAISKSAVSMLKMFFTRSVAMQCVGSQETANKKVIASTNFFGIMDVLIRNQRGLKKMETGPKEVQSIVGVVLSNARGWTKESYSTDSITESDAFHSSSAVSKDHPMTRANGDSMRSSPVLQVSQNLAPNGFQTVIPIPVTQIDLSQNQEISNVQVIYMEEKSSEPPLKHRKLSPNQSETQSEDQNAHESHNELPDENYNGLQEDDVSSQSGESDDLNNETYLSSLP